MLDAGLPMGYRDAIRRARGRWVRLPQARQGQVKMMGRTIYAPVAAGHSFGDVHIHPCPFRHQCRSLAGGASGALKGSLCRQRVRDCIFNGLDGALHAE